jgi:hypothetical protein
MGLKITNRDYRYGMRAFCDHCGEEVLDGQCNVLSSREIPEGGEVDFVIACKHPCTKAIDPRNRLANQELGECLVYLINNAKVDIEKTKKRIEMMREFFG